MDDLERKKAERAAEQSMEIRIDTILGLGLAGRGALRAMFHYGRAYGLNEAAHMIGDSNADASRH